MLWETYPTRKVYWQPAIPSALRLKRRFSESLVYWAMRLWSLCQKDYSGGLEIKDTVMCRGRAQKGRR